MPSERAFGLSVGAVCLALAAWMVWRGSPTAGLVLGVVGAALLMLGITLPSALRVPNRIWWRLAQLLGWINSRIILTIFFVLVLTPLGLVMRAIGKNPLRGQKGATNWSPYPTRIANAHHYERLY